MKRLLCYFKTLLPVVFITGIAITATGQSLQNKQDTLPSLRQTVNAYAVHSANHPIEKIYLQLNKPWYNRADTIWFKVYTVIGSSHQLTGLSKVAYAELVNSHDSVMQRLNLKLESGMANGDFTLPLSLTPGIYRIRAYTNWMKNDGERYFYDQEINIGGLPANTVPAAALSTPAITSTNNKNALPDMQFFPEGGTLVNGLRSRVAFKALNPDGTAATIKGSITSSAGDTVAAFESGHAGMGLFAFTPQDDKSYKAILKFANGATQTADLPKAATEGYSITVNNADKDTLLVKIAANASLFKNKAGSGFFLLAQSGGKIYYTTSGTLTSTVFTLHISKSHFPTGVVRLTLFSDLGEPLNERVLFIQQPDNLLVNVSSEKNNYTENEKIAVSLGVNTYIHQPAIGAFSVTVVNESLVPADEFAEPTIFSQLLLSDEIHGVIADPGYYLANHDESRVADLDMLMLTQGYRKLEWKQLLDTTKQAPKFLAEDGLSVSGIVKTMDGKLVANGKVTLIATRQLMTADTMTNKDGRFNITGLDINDKLPIMIKAVNENNKNNVDIVLDQPELAVNPVLTYTVSANIPPATLQAMQKSYQDNERLSMQGKQLKEVKIHDSNPDKNKNDLSGSANLNGPGNADQIVMGKNLLEMGCPIITDCLAAKLAFVSVQNGKVYDVSRGRSGIMKSGPMNVFIDGSIGSLDDISVDQIYSIEVLTSVKYKAIYGHDAAGGLILVTTKRGIPKNEQTPPEKAPGMLSYVFNGYYKARTFYTPKYEAPNPVNEQRTAIYWKPDILTDKDGKASLQYINAGKGNYQVVVEGIDGDGRLGRMVYRYKVE